MFLTVLDTIRDEKLMENSHDVGTYFLHGLAKLRDQYEVSIFAGLSFVFKIFTKEKNRNFSFKTTVVSYLNESVSLK